MTIRAVLAAAALIVVFAGCGSSSDDTRAGTVNARSLETQLADQVRDQDHGSRYTDVHCVPRTKTTFECVGQYTPSRAAAEDAMAGIDTTGFTTADWEAVREQRTGPISYEITVDPADGSWVSQPR